MSADQITASLIVAGYFAVGGLVLWAVDALDRRAR